jgi:hypothetical protein
LLIDTPTIQKDGSAPKLPHPNVLPLHVNCPLQLEAALHLAHPNVPPLHLNGPLQLEAALHLNGPLQQEAALHRTPLDTA